MARNARIGCGDFPWEGAIAAVLAGVAIKFAIHELSTILEHGFDNWRRHRFGW
jgi:hypothetical protein